MKKIILSLSLLCIFCLLNQKLYALDGSVERSAHYIMTHLDELNQIRLNEGYSSNVKSAVSFDIVIETTIGNFSGKFIDFDGDKGYLTIGENLKVYNIEYEGESPFYLTSSFEKYYNEVCGYYYLDENNNKIGIQKNVPNKNARATVYPGQETAGEGKIYDYRQYLEARHGTGFNLIDSYRIYMILIADYVPNYNYYDFSMYYRQEGTAQYLEYLMEAYNAYVVADVILKTNYDNKADFSSYFYDPYVEENALYMKRKNQDNMVDRKMSVKTLYKDIRKDMVQNYGEVGSLNASYIGATIKRVFSKKGINIDYASTTKYGEYVLRIGEWIHKDIPIIFKPGTSQTYGSSPIPIVGFHHYEKIEGWWIFETKVTVIFGEVRDGLPRSSYIDFAAYSGQGDVIYFTLR